MVGGGATARLPSLSEALQRGFSSWGVNGGDYSYRSRSGLNLMLSVALLWQESRLREPRYTLAFLSPCCGSRLVETWSEVIGEGGLEVEEIDFAGFVCDRCEKPHQMGVTDDYFFFTGAWRSLALGVLSEALETLWAVDTLEATLAAADILEEILEAQETYLTPEWAERTCGDLLRLRYG